MIGRDWPVPFALERSEDVSQISGVGRVAAGVIWPDQRATLRWAGEAPPPGFTHCVRQVNTFERVDEVEAVHGHNGLTRLCRRDPAVPCVDLGLSVFGVVAWYGTRSRVTHWGVRWDRGPAVTWRCDPDRPTRIEQWPDGAAAAFQELGDLGADEALLAWVPSDALLLASAAASIEGRRWRVASPGYTAVSKSPHRR